MIALYCRAKHGTGDALCIACADLETYALRRLGACRYGEAKPACSKCPTHCYAPARRQAIREVMAHSGPRMPGRHPVMAIRHLADKLRPAPLREEESQGPGRDDQDAGSGDGGMESSGTTQETCRQ